MTLTDAYDRTIEISMSGRINRRLPRQDRLSNDTRDKTEPLWRSVRWRWSGSKRRRLRPGRIERVSAPVRLDVEKFGVADKPPSPVDGVAPVDPQDAAFLALHGEREGLERELTLAQQQQRFGSEDAAIERARLREASLLIDLDRVMTLIRAAEYRRQPGARRW